MKIIKVTVATIALLTTLLLIFAYIQYRGLKRILSAKLSDKTTAFIGQKVEIEDISFSPFADIDLYNIRVRNPESFSAGDLLKVRRISVKMRYGRLAKGIFSFDHITVYSPDLTVLRDDRGMTNISEKLMNFLRTKPTLAYQIDNFDIKSGSFDFREDGSPNNLFRNNNIDMQIKNLSSSAGVKTSISGNTTIAGGSKIELVGWAYLKDEPKQLNISLSSRNISLVQIREFLNRHGIDTKKTKITFLLNAEGDTHRGVAVRSGMGIKETGFIYLKKDVKDIRLVMRAFLNIRGNAFSVEDVSLLAGGVAAAVVKGDVKKAGDDVVYTALMKIDRLDLSAFNFIRDIKVDGLVTTANLSFRGSLKKPIQEVSGVVRLSGGAIRSQDTDIGRINAQAAFSPGKAITVKAEAAADISKMKGYVFDNPAKAHVRMTANGDFRNMGLLSSVDLSSVAVRAKDETRVYAENVSLDFKGNIKGKAFLGQSLLNVTGLKYDTYQVPWLRAAFALESSRNILTARNATIQGKNFIVSAKQLTTVSPSKAADVITVKVEDMDASYPETKTEIKKASLSIGLNTGKKTFSGDLSFSIGGIMFKGIRAGSVEGSGRFDDKDFYLDIPKAELSGGEVKISAKGRSSGGPFPVTIVANATNINLDNLSAEAQKTAKMPYAVSGVIGNVIFEGTLNSPESVKGRTEAEAENISVTDKDKKKLVQGISLKSRVSFRERNLDFISDLTAGKIGTHISGSVNRFMKKGRIITAKVSLPEANISDIREAFWDAFPDSLLYAGLDGSLSSDLTISYNGNDLNVNGQATLQDLVFQGENGEYSVGPIKGVLPIAYSKTGGQEEMFDIPSFGRSEFGNLTKFYTQKKPVEGYSRIKIGSLRYGFKLLEDVDLLVRQKGSVLNVDKYSGTIFGGRLSGSAAFDISEGLNYRAGMVLEGLSMTKLCEEIEPIKGYISGKVNGITILKGSGTSLSRVIGRADFWTYEAKDEKMKISKEFLQKVGGASMRGYLGDRRFDKGEMSLYLQDGFVIFRDLDISHKNIFGMTDLSIKVAPFNNRIALDHLMWAITEAAQRAKKE